MNKIILVHGYNKDKNDMLKLKTNLEKYNYDVILADLPLTFEKLEYCIELFKRMINKIFDNLEDHEKLNFIGHSTGGLIIRNILAEELYKDKINKCVLISTPNKGSELADIAKNLSKTFVNIFKTVNSISTENVKKMNLSNPYGIDIGAIAGNNNNLVMGSLLSDENDGRIKVSSVKFEGLKDFIVLPYGHKDIHYQGETAELAVNFLKKGTFKNNKGDKNGI